MKHGRWEFYVKSIDLQDGTYAITITDDVLDHDCWPVDSICIRDGYVRSQNVLYSSSVYDMPNMVGWGNIQVAEWTQYEPGITTHPQNAHNIMKLSI